MPEILHPRVFLVVVDESEELRIAVHYAVRRAAHTGGRVALLYVIEPSELQAWRAIEDLAREERREEAEHLDPGAGSRHWPRRTGAANLLFDREAGRPFAHSHHHRSRPPHCGGARCGQLRGSFQVEAEG